MNYKQYNDYELIYMIRENDEESKSILYEKYYPIIYNLASEYFHKYSCYGYDYDDFVQEGIIAFHKALCTYDEKKDMLFYSFVLMCIRRGMSTFCRTISYGNKKLSSKNFVDIDDCSIEDEKSSIDFSLHEQEVDNIMRKVIFELPLEAGAIIELKWNGFTYREIGELLDIPSSSVEFKSRKGRKYLQKLFQKYNN